MDLKKKMLASKPKRTVSAPIARNDKNKKKKVDTYRKGKVEETDAMADTDWLTNSDTDVESDHFIHHTFDRRIRRLEMHMKNYLLSQMPHSDSDGNSFDISERKYEEKIEWKIPCNRKTPMNQKSPVYNLNKWSYGIQVKTESSLEESHVTISAHLRGQAEAGTPTYQTAPTITFSLNHNYQKHSIVRICDLPFGCPLDKAVYKQEFQKNMLEGVARNGRIPFAISASHVDLFSTDGVLRWSINGYKAKRGLIKRGYLNWVESPPFSTSRAGYRLKINLVLRDTIVARVQFLTGDFDNDLPQSFSHRTTITVLSTSATGKSKIKQSAVSDLAKECSYEIALTTHENLKKNKYLKDDTLQLQISTAQTLFPVQSFINNE